MGVALAATDSVGARRDRIRRRAYLSGVLIGTPCVVVTWAVRRVDNLFVANVYPLLTVFLVALTYGLCSRRLSVPTAERLVFFAISSFFLTQIAFAIHGAPDLPTARTELSESSFLNIGLLFMFAYLAYETRTALRLSLAIFGAFLTIVSVRVLPEIAAGRHLSEGVGFLRTATSLAAGIVLLYALAQVKEQLAETRSTAEALDALAHTDPLTGLANRRRLHLALEGHFSEATDEDLAVILLDVDTFKRINDEHGHDVGDEVLQAVARVLQQELRATDMLGRWGGEEFLILASRTDAHQAHMPAERCREVLAASALDTVGPVTASFGVAARRPGDTSRTLLKRADDATYEAKRLGRNRVKSSVS
jgi:diguanylate cyclase (GGDEF)-like protein